MVANNDNDNNDTVVISNKEQKAANIDKYRLAVECAISDSGATGHFLVEGAPVTNLQVADNPISITITNGKSMTSSHTCNLEIPWLPNHMTEAHTLPGLAHASLISTRKFCEARCKVIFDADECRVYYKGNLVISGGKDENTALWKLPINPTTNQMHNQKGSQI